MGCVFFFFFQAITKRHLLSRRTSARCKRSWRRSVMALRALRAVPCARCCCCGLSDRRRAGAARQAENGAVRQPRTQKVSHPSLRSLLGISGGSNEAPARKRDPRVRQDAQLPSWKFSRCQQTATRGSRETRLSRPLRSQAVASPAQPHRAPGGDERRAAGAARPHLPHSRGRSGYPRKPFARKTRPHLIQRRAAGREGRG